MTEEILRMRMLMIRFLVIGGMGGDIEKIGLEKIIIWETLRSIFHISRKESP